MHHQNTVSHHLSKRESLGIMVNDQTFNEEQLNFIRNKLRDRFQLIQQHFYMIDNAVAFCQQMHEVDNLLACKSYANYSRNEVQELNSYSKKFVEDLGELYDIITSDEFYQYFVTAPHR